MAMRYVITKHAMERMRERFRLRFAASHFSNPQMLQSLMNGQLSTASHKNEWKSNSFCLNRVAWMYGPGIEIYKKSGVYYVCKVKDDVCTVLTVSPKILFYK